MSGYTETVGLNIVATGTFNNLLSEVNKFKSQLKALKLPDNVTKKLEGSFDKLNVEAEKFKNILNKGITTKGDFSKLMSSAKSVEAAMKVIKTEVASISNKQIRLSIQNLPEIKQLEGELNKLLNLQKQFKNFGTSKGMGAASAKEVVQIEQLISKMQQAKGIENAFRNVGRSFATGNIDKMTQSITRLVAEVDQYRLKMANVQGATANTGAIISWANSLQQGLNKTVSEADRLKNSINQLQTSKFNQMKGSIDGISSGLNTATNNMRNFVSSQTQAASKTSQLNEQVGLLRTQANYFFGLQNIGRLISRGIREAAESVRDLDKAMTATAVVTPYTVTEMWDMLPEYTALANKLGATTQGAYETMTLYFQQGLNKEQTFQIGEETMKMARIAGLDYAQTTNMMTAALRGFNMELNNTSAQRVNDVYSKLAAITASDTRELGLAMERTASIANSAGMDFGNTTAFLAQMIETTREAPENLGTAMKTIVARFQELKQNPYEIGEVEGEEVDFNRVDKALKTIGVDLMDNKDKFRDLDEVFLEISEKWDGLSQTQQRYIATIAAGARQQSRFIAMVQNYDRLKELTEAAANSEGAADIQFGKTLDSYEAKVNKLKNAWQTFTMGLADNKVIKGGIGILEKIITLADKIIDLFGKAGKAIGGDFGKSIAQMTAAFGMAAIGFRGLYGGAVAGLGMLDRMAAKRAAGEAGILSAGTGAVKGMSGVTREERAAVMQKRKELYQMMSKGGKGGVPLFNTKDFQQQIKNLSADQQKALYSTSPGLRQALQKSWGNAYKGMNLTKETNAAVKNQIKTIDGQIKNGETTVQKALARTMNPYQVGKDIGGATGREIMTAIDKEITKMSAKESAHHDAFKKMKQDYGHQASKLVAQGKLKSSDAKGWVQERLRADTGKMMQEENLSKTPVAINKATAAMSAFSGATMKGGQAMMGLGMAMSTAGFPAFGGIVMTVGTGIMGLGMAAEGAAAGISKIGMAIKALKASNPELLAISAVMAAVAAGLVAIKVIRSKAEKEARETGDKIVDSYTQATKKSKKELDEFKSYQEKWSEWTAGVDANGNNVGLEASEYQEYLKAVKNITKAHPELIKGYNALGNAIVDNNTALKDAINLTQKDEKNALKEYLNSYDAIVAKQKTYKSWQKANGTTGQGEQARSNAIRAGAKGSTGGQKAKTMIDEANAVVESINKIEGGAEVLKNYGIEVNEAGELTERGLENLRTHLGDVTNAVKAIDLSPDEKGQKALDKMTESANTYAKTVQDLEKVSKDSYDWGWAYATKQGYNQIESGLVVPFQTAIERAAEKGLTQTEFQNQIDIIGQKYQNLGGHLKDFQQIQKEVKGAQEELGKSANFDAYTDTVSVATAEMDGWIAELKSSTEEADHILAEWLENEKTIMLDYSQQAAQDLSEGLNQDQALFASSANASKRYESIKEQITDYASGLNSMKAILDDAMTDQNIEGNGSLAFEQASISILGDDFVTKNADNIDKIKSQMKEYQGWLQDSEGNTRSLEETYTSFWDHITKKAMESPDKTIEGIDGKLGDFFVKTEDGFEMNAEKWSKLTDEQMGALAEQGFDMSADWMSGMLNIGRQLGYYSSANIDMIKQGLVEQSGQGAAVGEDSTVYKRRSDFEEESKAAMNSKAETQEIIAEAKDAGIELIGNVSEMTGKSIKTMMDNLGVNGEKSGENFGRKFIEQFEGLNYNKDEVSQAIDTALASSDFTDAEKTSLQEAQANLNNIWDNILEKKDLGLDEDKSAEETTAQAAQSIDSKLGQMLAEEGKLSKDAYTDAEGNGLGYGALQTVLGGKGKDTLAQVFASGTDLAGNKLTDEQFKAQLSQLQNLRKYYAEQEALMRTNAENTSGDDKTWWTDQANYAQQAIGYLDTYIQKGQEAHQEKIQQNEEENASEDAKTQNKVENDEQQKNSSKDKTDSEKGNQEQLSQSYMEYLDSLNAVNVGQEGQQLLTPDQLAAKFGLSDADIADYKSRYQALQQQLAANPYADMGLSQEQGDLLGLKKTFADGQTDLTNFKNTFSQVTSALGPDLQLTKDQLGQIKQNISGLDGSQLNSLNTQQLLADLKLDNKQIAALEAANIDIPVETDDTNLDDTQKKKEDLGKPVVVPVKTLTTIDKNTNEGKNKEEPVKNEETQQVTKNLEVTYVTTITNEGEVTAYLDSRISSIVQNAKSNKNLNLQASITVDYKKGKQAKADRKSATVDYKKGKQEDAKDQKAKVNYVRGSQEGPKSPKTAQVNYTLGSQANPKDKHAKVIYDEKATGQNNRIVRQSLPTFNSLAVGNVKKKPYTPANIGNGLTLTGEEGFEIAWLPSENRSMILGAKGPQMVNLPKDAVVWTNEQSKKILKQKAIPANSMRSGTGPSKSSSSSSSSRSSSSSSSKKNNKDTANNNKAAAKNNSDAKKVIKKSGQVYVWWENQARKIEGTQRKVDKLLKKFEKELKEVGKTVSGIESTTASYKKQLNESIRLNKQSEAQAKKELKNLAGKKSNYSISYQKTTKTKKGKTKKETVNGKVNLANYISYDSAHDTYVINQKAIDKVAASNKSRAEAIKKLAEEKINDKLSKRNTATDNITKAQEALEKLSNDIYENFYRWEKSITQVYLLTQKLEAISKKISIAGAQADLQFTKLEAGIGSFSDSLPKIQQALQNERTQLLQQATGKKDIFNASLQEFKDSLDFTAYAKKYLNSSDSTEARDDYKAASLAFGLLNELQMDSNNFDYNKVIQELNDKQYNEETNNRIKAVLDKIFEKQNNFLDAEEDAYKVQAEIYEKMEEYQSFISDFEQDLISGVDELKEDEINKLEKINSSLSQAYKDLIDEVKRKLDERRKQEDNAKTESDIAKKQQRLAALRADTSGGHQVEIAQLEKEIADAQQDYQRSLEDQLLDRLQQQGDEAEKQRQRQIDLLEAAKEIAQQTGTNLEEVKKWLENPEANIDKIREAWLAQQGYNEATPNQQKQLEEQFNVEWGKYTTYFAELPEYQKAATDSLLSLEESVDSIAKQMPSLNKNQRSTAWMKENGFTAGQLKKLGYKAQSLSNAGYTNKQIHDAGYTAAQFKAVKGNENINTAIAAGYTPQQAAKAYGATAAMTTANMSGAATQKATKASAKTLQAIVNKSNKDKATQADMAGVKTSFDINGKKKGGVTSATLNKYGTYAAANSGGTVYFKKWNSKTGTTTGKVTSASIYSDKLKIDTVKNNKKEFTDALVYAIKNSKPGAKINKNIKNIISTLGLTGKKYKLKNGIYGSIGSDGKIYYNDGKKGVQVWNAASGKLTLEKYNKNTFLKKAKYKNVGDEYKQVLKANGVKSYSTGGIADYTGPAWLHGTPSKPELVLNAKDTKNFIALKDILSGIMKTSDLAAATSGDATFEININVDHIDNDYDVDRMVDRVKKEIVKSAGYRNVTQVRNFK